MIRPWLAETWHRLAALDGRLPHALLFAGPPGLGKRELADALAARLLCALPDPAGHACGRCSACTLRLAGNHPDLIMLVPAAESAPEPDGKDGDDAPAKAKSTQIVIEQVREVQKALAVTGHQSSTRVVVVDPAEAMNVFTANALLKLLEEPPPACAFILVSSAPRRLLPTIRSRCQQWTFGRPSGAAVEAFASGADAGQAALLALNGGMPLAAERAAERGGAALLTRFVRDIARLPEADPLKTAAQWDAWLKSKEALAAGFGMVQLADWMQRWVTDLAMVRLGGRARYFPAQAEVFAALAARTDVARATNCYNEFASIRRVAHHPLNARLMLEDMLLRYVRTMSEKTA